ncbi:MAG: SpaA isopeptide-forming pilin-related protein [Oscillospiraceae bacterium]|nr:SpaA isopeptide-forming pilin-related protein [Oscillospiraceae bacterium]
MKKSKILASILAVVMILSIALPLTAFAEILSTNDQLARSDATITVTSPKNLVIAYTDFTALRLFNVTVSTDGQETSADWRDRNYAYTPAPGLQNFLDWANTNSNPNRTIPYGATPKEFRLFLESLIDPSNQNPGGVSVEVPEGNVQDITASGYIYGADLSYGAVMLELTRDLENFQNSGGVTQKFTSYIAAQTVAGHEVKFTGLPYGYYMVIGKGLSDVPEDHSKKVKAHSALVTVDYIDKNAEIRLKADAPTIDKWVKNDNDHEENTYLDWQKWADYDISDTIPFEHRTFAPNMFGYDCYEFIVHDVMSKGLTFLPNSVQINIATGTHGTAKTLTGYITEGVNTGANRTNDPGDSDYIVTAVAITSANYDELEEKLNLEPTDIGGTYIRIRFNPLTFKDFNNETSADLGSVPITIQYSAVLNEKAVISEQGNPQGNPNRVFLEYSNNPYATGSGENYPDDEDEDGETGETPEDEVFVYTYQIDIFKYTNDVWEPDVEHRDAENFIEGEFSDNGTARLALAGARFELHKNSPTGTKVEFRYNGISAGGINAFNKEAAGTASYMVNDEKLALPITNLNQSPLATVTTTTTVLESPESGKINVYGLDHGVYYLVEIEAPAGFHKLEAPIKITVGRTIEAASTSLYDRFIGNYKVSWMYQPHGRSPVESGDTVSCIDVLNLTGPRLPGTGGIGTTIVIIAGILIIAFFAAAIVASIVVYRKRRVLNALK